MAEKKEKSVTRRNAVQQCLTTGKERACWHNQPQTEKLIHSFRRQKPFGEPSHSHAVKVNELALPLVALGSQEVFKVFDLVS